jgi:predicted nucleotide-binding protein (sugar kinase/HSP70/actin superfamily)
VIRAAFTKEVDFFKRAGIDYVDVAVTLNEKNYFNQQLWEAWGHRLGLTRDEHDHAVEQAYRALDEFDKRIQERGKEVLESVEREGKIAVLVLSRPYHSDPGLHHGIPEELQALGYPILSIRSIPKDPVWLHRFFEKDMKEKRVEDPLDIRDAWPENYSANSVMKVWAARFAARHPNVALLDLSSFKCGHDAPTYGLIDSIVKQGGTPRLVLHDIDANKPAGSIAIRVRTFGHTLSLRQDELDSVAKKKLELQRRIQERLRQLRGEAPLPAAPAAPPPAAERAPSRPSRLPLYEARFEPNPAPSAPTAANRAPRKLPLVAQEV